LKLSRLNQQHISYAKTALKRLFSFYLCAIGFGAIFQGLWLSDSFFSVPCGAFSIERKKVVSEHLNRPEHFNRLGNFQSQRRQVKAFEIFF